MGTIHRSDSSSRSRVHEQKPLEQAAPRNEARPAPAQERPATPVGHSSQSSFESGGQAHSRRPVNLGNDTASTLRTEQRGDGSANCLERAAGLARDGDEVVLLRDSQDAVGHAVVRHPDGAVTDPNTPEVRYESLGQFQATHPQYHSPTAIQDTQLEQVLDTPPGAGRDALISQLGLSGVANQAVADGPISRNLSLTFEPAAQEGQSGRLQGSITEGPYTGVEVGVSWDPSRRNADGRFQVEVEVTAEVGSMTQGEARVGPFGVEGGTAAGVADSRSYTLNLTQDEINQLQTGQLPLPSITDPLAMPPGTQVTMGTEVFGSTNLGASFHGLSISDEVRSGAGYSFGVERLEGDRVRLSVGPTAALEHTQSLGLGLEVGGVEVSAELSRSTELSGAALASVELDLSTPEGRAAYDEFLSTRNLPPDGPGVSNRTTSQSLSVEEAAAAGLTVGPLSVGSNLWSESTNMVVTTQGGETTATVNTTAAYSGNNISSTYRYENGQPVLDSMSFDVSYPGGQRATVQVDGMQGVESLQRVAFEAAQANLFAAWSEAGTPTELMERFAQDPDTAALATQPGDPGFSGDAWLRAYDNLFVQYGALPDIPPVAMAAIRAGEYEGAPADRAEALRVDLVGNLRAERVNEGVFSGVADHINPDATRDWLDSGLRNAPGVTVTLPPG